MPQQPLTFPMMKPSERELDYCFGDTLPPPGTAFEVAPGVHWVRMPLPFALDHINLWVINDPYNPGDGNAAAEGETDAAPGWTIIDAGIGSDITHGHWESVFDGLLDGKPVHRVLCTHFHPDHFGSAHWLCEGGARHRWQARLWMTVGEYATGRLLAQTSASTGSGGVAAAEHMRRHGFDDKVALEQIAHRAAYYPTLVPSVPPRFRRMREHDQIMMHGVTWRVIIGQGHSPEHAALYSDKRNILIAGDMVLPRISTNVSVFDTEPEGDPLGDFLTSLGRYDDLPADVLVLPSHGKPFRGLHPRLRQLREHHSARLGEVIEACSHAPRSAADIVPIMFPRALDTHQMTFALGEALAHLNHLWLRNALRREVGADDVYRFTTR